jgi:DNA-directed RNA polymerase specialized sigma24 family protein
VGSQIGTVKSHLSRAVSVVRAQLKDRYREIALEHR